MAGGSSGCTVRRTSRLNAERTRSDNQLGFIRDFRQGECLPHPARGVRPSRFLRTYSTRTSGLLDGSFPREVILTAVESYELVEERWRSIREDQRPGLQVTIPSDTGAHDSAQRPSRLVIAVRASVASRCPFSVSGAMKSCWYSQRRGPSWSPC